MPRTKKATTGTQVEDTNPAGNSASNSDPPPTPNTNRRIFHDVCTTANIPADRLGRFRLALIAQETSKRIDLMIGGATYGEGGIELIARGKKPLELDELKETVVKKELKKWVGENLTKEQAKLVDKAGILKNKRQRKKVPEISASSADASGGKEVKDINEEVLSERPGDINKIAGVSSVAAKEKEKENENGNKNGNENAKEKEKEKEEEKEGKKENENENGNENAKEKEKEKGEEKEGKKENGSGNGNENAKEKEKEKEKEKTKGKKRKSNELENEGTQAAAVQEPVVEIDWDDDLEFTWSCGDIRKKIRQFIENGGMKVTEFQSTICANSNSYGRFMKLRGPWSGIDNSTFSGATRFFKALEAANLPMPKKPKLAVATGSSSATTGAITVNNLDISTVHLDGEDTDSVPVYDSCDEVRRKISAHLRKPGVTQAQFLRDIAAQFQTDMVRIQGKQLTDFRTKSGPLSGNTSRVFYSAYVYFEKLRVKDGKAKTKHRLEMENRWVGGVNRENVNGGWIFAHKDDILSRDKWGTLRIDRRHR